ncbi:MAG: HAMP domain-containing protein [Candidatus Manganitrophaceae bacterium]|nr:MAG: HAMP domain-containing protein [Candidatus Manganitrophaceae bacterium]
MSSRSDLKRSNWTASIRGRLALWYGTILGGVFLFVGILLYVYLSKNLHTDFDLSLRSTAEALARASLDRSPPLPELDIEALLQQFDNPDLSSNFFQLFDPRGRFGARSRNLSKRPYPLTEPALNNALQGKYTYETFIDSDRGKIRWVTYPVIQDGRLVNILQVGGSLRNLEGMLQRLRLILLLIFPATLLVAVTGGWLLTHRALQPVDAMAQVARQITAGDLSRRIPLHAGQDELSRLAETFNAMIAQLEESIQRLRQFSADASHELRTPLTILKGETELALRQARSMEEYQQTLASSLEEIDRISRIVEELFLLSKADLGEARLERKPVALAPLFRETLAQMELLAKEKELSLRFECREEATITGDSDRIRELLLNLVENAIRYTPPQGRIVVTLARERGHAQITVADTGIGIPKEDLPKIFDRFYRADSAREIHPKGSGLGLSICRWIVHAHGGTIQVDSTPGLGTLFTIRCPLRL